MLLYGDGWYMERENAEEALDLCEAFGGYPVGLVESQFGTWGILYWSNKEYFPNHRLDSKSALLAVTAHKRPKPGGSTTEERYESIRQGRLVAGVR